MVEAMLAKLGCSVDVYVEVTEVEVEVSPFTSLKPVHFATVVSKSQTKQKSNTVNYTTRSHTMIWTIALC